MLPGWQKDRPSAPEAKKATLDEDTVDWLKTTALNIWWHKRPKRRRLLFEKLTSDKEFGYLFAKLPQLELSEVTFYGL